MSAAPRPPESSGSCSGIPDPAESPGGPDFPAASDSRTSLHLRDPHARLFLDYWLIKCQEGKLPGRQHIDPVEMRSFLTFVVLLDVERRPAGRGLRFRYRLVGTHVVEIFGHELTGVYLDEVNPPDAYPTVEAHLGSVIQNGRPAVGCFALPAAHPHYRRYEHVTVPLASDGRTVDMLLGLRCGLPGPIPRTEPSPPPRAFL
jgi:hypothetical protein